MNQAEPISSISADLERDMMQLGERARDAAATLAVAPTDQKQSALRAMAVRIRASQPQLLAANAGDVERAPGRGQTRLLLDRLTLTPERIEAMARGLEDLAGLPDPVGAVMASWKRPNGLEIARVRVPIGVIGIIYESRPNVTADAGALCLKSGNAAILRGGSDSHQLSRSS